MATIRVKSGAAGAANGTSWTDAYTTIAAASAADAAGDLIVLSQAHAESGASSSNAFAGTNASPVRVTGADDAADPPTAVSTAPTITVTGTTFTWTGGVYTYGVNFVFSTASSGVFAYNSTGAFNQTLDSCTISVTGSGGGSVVSCGSASSGTHNFTELKNCTIKLGNSGQRIGLDRGIRFSGGSWGSGGTSPTSVFTANYASRGCVAVIDGFDFSNLGSSSNLVGAINDGGCSVVFRNCKLPASWTGALVASGQIKLGSRVEMHNCDNADTRYRLLIEDYGGTITHETTIVRTGGASDGTTTLSTKMASSANVAYPNSVLYSPEIVKWNTTTGSSVTATIEIVHDSQGAGTGSRFTNAEMWIEVQYLGTSGFPKSTFVTDAPADVLTAAADQTDSSETWTTTGLTTPVKQKLSVSFTPQEAGFVIARVVLAKASKTVYVDHKLTLS